MKLAAVWSSFRVRDSSENFISWIISSAEIVRLLAWVNSTRRWWPLAIELMLSDPILILPFLSSLTCVLEWQSSSNTNISLANSFNYSSSVLIIRAFRLICAIFSLVSSISFFKLWSDVRRVSMILSFYSIFSKQSFLCSSLFCMSYFCLTRFSFIALFSFFNCAISFLNSMCNVCTGPPI